MNQGTPTETLTFMHHDASATGARETDASGNLLQTTPRTAEYDPLGRNIADPGPYTTLDTEPPPDDSGISLFPPAEGYRPGRNTYAVDGIPVQEDYFMSIIDSGMIGGAFGLVEMAARMSMRDYSVRFNDGNRQYERFFGNEADARGFAFRMGQNTVWRNILVNETWIILNSLRPVAQQQDRKLYGPEETSPILNATVRRVERILRERPECRALFKDFTDEQLSKALNYGIIAHYRDQDNRLFYEGVVATTELYAEDDRTYSNRLIDALTFIDAYDTGPNDDSFFEPTFGINSSAKDWGISKRLRRSLRTPDDFRVLIILHEMVHKFDPSGKYDEPVVQVNGPLNSAVIEKCIREPEKDGGKKWWKPWTWFS